MLAWLLGLPSPDWDQPTYWSLDLETGGRDPRRDPILAVGMVPLRGGTIRLGETYRTLVRPEDGKEIDPASIRADAANREQADGCRTPPSFVAYRRASRHA